MLSELLANGLAIGHPPAGVTYQDDGGEVRIEATTRSPEAFFFVPFVCVWTGMFAKSIYANYVRTGHIGLPPWFALFFLFIAAFFWCEALLRVAGRVEIRLRGAEGEVFTGLGKLGWRRRFEPAEIEWVREGHYRGRHGYSEIVLEGHRQIRFGRLLSDKRRAFVLHALRVSLPGTQHAGTS